MTDTPSQKSKRWIGLDAFRGLTIAAMILVNNPGDYKHEFYQLGHAEWHGITFSDFIFPFFLFIVGISINLSLGFQLKKGLDRSVIYRKIIRRTVLLFLLGLVVSLLVYPATGGFRIAGVLQRIAMVYLICSILFLQSNLRVQLGVGATLLLGYWALLALVPVPGLGKPSFEPIHNLVSWFDRQFLPGMLYDGEHDPEGILSTLPSIATGISGMMAGYIYQNRKSNAERMRWWGIIGLLMLLIGMVWSLVFPLNKNLWTSSFVLFTSGMGMLILIPITWMVDEKGWKKVFFPFLVFGSNAITAYMLSFVLLYLVFPPFFGEGTALINVATDFFAGLGMSLEMASLIWAVIYTALCFLPVYLMYRRKLFLKV
jgi:predicted acyltransferase